MMESETFAFLLMRIDGMVISMEIREDNSFFSETLNTLCGAKPYKWIGDKSNHKIIRLEDKLRKRLGNIFNQLITEAEKRTNIKAFFNGIRNDGFIVFLRLRVLPLVDEKLMSEALSLLRKCEIEDLYEVNIFGTTEYFVGPSNLRKCVCRFCGQTRPKVNFKERNAHAIPEALGNKLVFCNDECITCNGKLSVVEKNLINYLNYRRAESQIKGKRNKIITNTGQNYVIEGSTGHLEISNEAIVDRRDNEIYVKYLDANLISHLGIYRALCKIAVDLMPNDCLDDFRTTIDWIKGQLSPHTVPDVYFAYREIKVSQPIARVFLRKEKTDHAYYPHCMVVLDLIDLRFFYIVPFAMSDGTSFLKSKALDNYMPFLTSLDKKNIKYDYIDMSQREGKYSHVTDILKDTETNLVDSSKFDNGKERNHNKADFPDLDLNKVKIRSVYLTHFDTNKDWNLLKDARIEYSDIIVDELRCKCEADLSEFCLNLKFTIRHILSKTEIFKTSVTVIASHCNPTEVYSIDKGEIFFQLVEYMIDAAIVELKSKGDKLMPDFDFKGLNGMIIENQLYVLPKDHIDD